MIEGRPVTREIEGVLVVEDNPSLRRTLEHALGERFADVRACSSVAEASAALAGWTPDLIILDFKLPDGDAHAILDLALARRPHPVVVAVSGEADPEDSFELAQRGVRAYLAKPITLDELEQAIAIAVDQAPSLSTPVRQLVGHKSLAAATTEVREAMIEEALARSSGSVRGAARLLDTSRQLLQYLRRKRA